MPTISSDIGPRRLFLELDLSKARGRFCDAVTREPIRIHEGEDCDLHLALFDRLPGGSLVGDIANIASCRVEAKAAPDGASLLMDVNTASGFEAITAEEWAGKSKSQIKCALTASDTALGLDFNGNGSKNVWLSIRVVDDAGKIIVAADGWVEWLPGFGGTAPTGGAFDGHYTRQSSSVVVVKDNLSASTDPGTGDDTADGYSVSSRWVNKTADKEFVCLDATEGAAVWKETTATGGGSGSGDMEAATYDPNGVEGDAFDMDNMVEGTDTKILTASERAAIAAASSHASNDSNPHNVAISQLGGATLGSPTAGEALLYLSGSYRNKPIQGYGSLFPTEAGTETLTAISGSKIWRFSQGGSNDFTSSLEIANGDATAGSKICVWIEWGPGDSGSVVLKKPGGQTIIAAGAVAASEYAYMEATYDGADWQLTRFWRSISGDLTNHLADTNNPHSVTAAQAGALDLATYDPGSVAGDAFDMDNMAEGSDTKILTAAERAKLAYIAITQAVDLDALESAVAALSNVVVLKGTWDASSGSFPGSGSALAGWSYIVSVGGTVDGVEFTANDRIVATTDSASTSTYASNWHKLDYTDAVLSVAGLTGAISDTGLRTALSLGALALLATVGTSEIDDAAVTLAKMANLAEARVIGRASGDGTGAPTALTAAQLKTILALAIGDVSGLQTALDAKATLYTLNAQSGTTYTLQASDSGKTVRCTNAAGCTVTVPASLALTEPVTLIGTQGAVALTASSTTLNKETGYNLASRAAFAAIQILPTGTADTYDVIGGLAAA